jgi:hypothetical protein
VLRRNPYGKDFPDAETGCDTERADWGDNLSV